MGYKDITTGSKIARPMKARFIKSEKGTFGLEIAFRFKEPGTQTDETLSWVGWLSDASRDRTMATLVEVLGYNGSMDTNTEGLLTDPNALNWDGDCELVVEREDYEGKTYPKVKWVNKVGGSAFQGLTPEVIKNGLGATGFRAAFLAAKAAAGSSKPKAQQAPQIKEEDLLF